MFGDPAHQRQRDRRRVQQQVLAGLQLQADLDGDFGEAVEFDGIDRGGEIALVCGHVVRAKCCWICRLRSVRPKSRHRESRHQAKASEAPDTSNSTRMVRRKPTSLMFRNARMPSAEPANSAGRLIARSITTLEDRPLRSSSSTSANICMMAMKGWTRPRWSPFGMPRMSHQIVGMAPGIAVNPPINPPPNPTSAVRWRLAVPLKCVNAGRNSM